VAKTVITLIFFISFRFISLGIIGFTLAGLPGLIVGLGLGFIFQTRLVIFMIHAAHLGDGLAEYPEERLIVAEHVSQLRRQLIVPELRISIADAEKETENSAILWSVFRHRKSPILHIEYDWIHDLPFAILHGIIAHEMSHLLPRQWHLAQLGLILAVLTRPAMVVIALYLGVSFQTACVLVLFSCALDLGRVRLARQVETASDDVAARLGWAASLRNFLIWSRERVGAKRAETGLLSDHPSHNERIDRLDHYLKNHPEQIVNVPVFENGQWTG
jgi:hypothetical protein